MGLLKKSSTKTTKPAKEYRPYITGGADMLQGAANSYAPTAAANASRIGSLIPSLFDKANGGNTGLNAAGAYDTDVLSGKYLGAGNPYLEGMVDNATDTATDTAGARFGALGGYGGTKYAEALGKGISDSELALRYGDYGAERDRMGAAVGQAPGLASAGTLDLQALLTAISQQQETAMGPSSEYARGIAGLLGNYTSTTTKDSALKALMDRASDAAKAYAASGSDRRLKREIQKIGEFADGLGIYIWRYIWGGPKVMGVMADEIERLRPELLGPVIAGYKTVFYRPVEIG